MKKKIITLKKNKNFYKPLYKKFIRLRQNVQSRDKLNKFKRKKWKSLLSYIKKLNKYNIYDHNIYFKPKYSIALKKKYNFSLLTRQKLKLFYNNLSKRYLKFIIKKSLKKLNLESKSLNNFFVEYLENRLDNILYRSNFVQSIRHARQYISHGQILVNKIVKKNISFFLKKGDIIEIKKKIKNLVTNYINKSRNWPIPPKYLQINYKTLQVFIVNKINILKLFYHFPFWLNLNNVIKYYLK